MAEFTYENVLAALEAAVADKGEDYVYPKAIGSCTYTNVDKSPSCIVGHVVAKLAPAKLEKIFENEYSEFIAEQVPLEQAEDYVSSFSVYALVRQYLKEDPNLYDSDNMYDRDTALTIALGVAQGTQDSGKTWGEALAKFKEEYAYQTNKEPITMKDPKRFSL